MSGVRRADRADNNEYDHPLASRGFSPERIVSPGFSQIGNGWLSEKACPRCSKHPDKHQALLHVERNGCLLGPLTNIWFRPATPHTSTKACTYSGPMRTHCSRVNGTTLVYIESQTNDCTFLSPFTLGQCLYLTSRTPEIFETVRKFYNLDMLGGQSCRL